MTLAKLYFNIGIIFLVITIIGLGLIIFGIYIISSYDQPVPIALNATIIGIVLVPLGSILTGVLFYHGLSVRKKEKQTE